MDAKNLLQSETAVESKLREEKERLENFLRYVGGGLGLIGPDCRIVWTNKASTEHFGLQQEAIGRFCYEITSPSKNECDNCPVPKAFATGESQTVVAEVKVHPGEVRHYQFTATPIPDPTGRLAQVMLVAQNVTDLVQAQRELQERTDMLERQNRKIAEISKQKSQFFASMSHELRTPLTSIIGFTEILLEDGHEPLTKTQRELLLVVSRNAERLLRMIDDLLDISKIESRRMTVTLSRVCLPPLIRQVVETMSPLVRDKDLALVAEIPDDLPAMRTDDQKLGQILVNLVSNAIKFTPKGHVTISAALAGGKVKIQVSDTGIGIRRSDFGKIFQEFEQIASAGCGNGGAGLGLAITRKMVHLLHGEIKLTSKLGEGSTFTVTLPVLLTQRMIDRRARATAE